MSDDHAAPDAHAQDHGDSGLDGGPDDHGHGGGHDDHGHGGTALGPIDWKMWGIGLIGVIAALIVVAGFAAATGFNFAT